jgi:hypothetical protein
MLKCMSFGCGVVLKVLKYLRKVLKIIVKKFVKICVKA